MSSVVYSFGTWTTEIVHGHLWKNSVRMWGSGRGRSIYLELCTSSQLKRAKPTMVMVMVNLSSNEEVVVGTIDS